MTADGFGVVITTYDSVSDCEALVTEIRESWGPLKNCTIVIVSTHPSSSTLFRGALIEGVTLVPFGDAPGNEGVCWSRVPNPAGPYVNWRQEFLPVRILLSMKKGLEAAEKLSVKAALHLHADTRWRPNKIGNLVRDLATLDRYVFVGDLSLGPEQSSRANKVLPLGLHFQPEGLLLNVERCRRVNFGFGFSDVFEPNSGFRTHNYGAIEALFGQFLHWCVTGRNIVSFTEPVHQDYWRSFRARTIRPYHGSFASGLVNVTPHAEGLKAKIKNCGRVLRRLVLFDDQGFRARAKLWREYENKSRAV